MEWIKKNYDQFSMFCFAALLCAVAIFLILQVLAFYDIFARISGQVTINRTIPPSNASALEAAKQEALNPPVWNNYDGSLFVSAPYILYRVNGQIRLVNPQITLYVFHPPIPNKWFYDHHLDPLDPKALEDDPSDDGFSNIDKWTWDKTMDPTDPNAHPPYWTKLRLVRFIQIPFRLKFEAYDGDTYQINTIDVRQPSQFLTKGDQIVGTKFKIVGFEKKTHTDANGIDHDDSELTIQNLETKQKLVLILSKTMDSPDSYGLFEYLWKGDINIQVKKDKTFSLKPEADVQYKLVDINRSFALIQNLKTGENIKVTPAGAANAH